MKNNLKFIIAVVVIIILGVFVWSGKKNEVVNTTSTSEQNSSAFDTSKWKTFSDPAKGITFKYPEEISATYIHAVDWPPKLQVESGPFYCTPGGEETSRAGQTARKTISGKDYCVTKVTEGAAGSIYTQYAYATDIQKKVLFLTFSLRAVQCGNYDEPQRTACDRERAAFTIDPIVNQIIQTVKL